MPSLATLLAVLAGALPVIAGLAYLSIRPNATHLREALWVAALLGALVAVPIAAAELLIALPLDTFASVHVRSAFHALFVAAIPEEVGKLLIFILLVLRHEDFTKPIHAVFLGLAVALGFAGIENVLYVTDASDWAATALARLMSALPMHAATGLIMGYFAARAVAEPARRGHALAAMVAGPIAIHAAYDYPVFVLVEMGVFHGIPLSAQTAPFFAMFLTVLVAIAVTSVAIVTRLPRLSAAPRD